MTICQGKYVTDVVIQNTAVNLTNDFKILIKPEGEIQRLQYQVYFLLSLIKTKLKYTSVKISYYGGNGIKKSQKLI